MFPMIQLSSISILDLVRCSYLNLRLQFQADLRQDAHQELVDVVVERRRGLGVLGLVRVGHGLRIWWKDKIHD